MGISVLSAAMILAEHRYRPIAGKIITIGRHSVALNGEQMDRMLAKMGVPKRPGAVYELDAATVGVDKSNAPITQESFFAAFTDAEVLSMDVTDYEGAAIVHDMQDELPPHLVGAADFVFNGSCLDDIFDPAAALRNVSRLTKPGGRFFCSEQGNSHPTAYLKFSVDWFMDFCAINNYADCKTYIGNKPNTLGVPLIGPKAEPLVRGPFDEIVYSYNPYVVNAGGPGYDCSQIEAFSRYQVYCLAEKGPDSTDHRNPIRKHYRTDPEHNAICLASAKRFLASPRPLFRAGIPFDLTDVPRIDSSDYPEQIVPVAVAVNSFLD